MLLILGCQPRASCDGRGCDETIGLTSTPPTGFIKELCGNFSIILSKRDDVILNEKFDLLDLVEPGGTVQKFSPSHRARSKSLTLPYPVLK